MTIYGRVLLAAACAMAAAGSLAAADKATDWKNWSERARAISDAIGAGEAAGMKTACNGVTGVVIGQGFQFPYWGQRLIGVCTAIKDGFDHKALTRKEARSKCADLQALVRDIGKAQPVAEAPEASVTALYLARQLDVVREQVCNLHKS